MSERLTNDELIRQVDSPGWKIGSGNDDAPVTGSLGELVKISHDRKTRGEEPGLIEHIENAIELDMLQLEELWRHLGLPV